MNVFKFLGTLFIALFVFTSCIIESYRVDDYQVQSSAGDIENYDLWYLDYHATEGADEIPFMQLAFTLSFQNGRMYANNNIVDIGIQGDGFGIQVGEYTFNRGNLVSEHDLDGLDYFELIQNPNVENEIEMYHAETNTSYFLIGYNTNDFDYDKLFYENIEYLLQDFEIWNKKATSIEGVRNEFDAENFLNFTAEGNNTFKSSLSEVGTNVDNVLWSYQGDYEVSDIYGFDNLKVLTLYYDSVNSEKFELTVSSDNFIELFHINSQTTYDFEGQYIIQYLKNGKKSKKTDRKRQKVKRRKVRKILY